MVKKFRAGPADDESHDPGGHPSLSELSNREWGGVFFRMAQVLTGHGCFGCVLVPNWKETDDAMSPLSH